MILSDYKNAWHIWIYQLNFNVVRNRIEAYDGPALAKIDFSITFPDFMTKLYRKCALSSGNVASELSSLHRFIFYF